MSKHVLKSSAHLRSKRIRLQIPQPECDSPEIREERNRQSQMHNIFFLPVTCSHNLCETYVQTTFLINCNFHIICKIDLLFSRFYKKIKGLYGYIVQEGLIVGWVFIALNFAYAFAHSLELSPESLFMFCAQGCLSWACDRVNHHVLGFR